MTNLNQGILGNRDGSHSLTTTFEHLPSLVETTEAITAQKAKTAAIIRQHSKDPSPEYEPDSAEPAVERSHNPHW